jgi:hypothetical protein
MEENVKRRCFMFGFGKKKKEKEARLLELQNIIMNDTFSGLMMTEKQIMDSVNILIENNNRISADCARIVQSTVKPDVFFERMELMEMKTVELTVLENYVAFADPKPSQVLEVYRKEKNQVTDQFLTRYFNSVLDKNETLKTDTGRLKNLQKCYNSLQPYYKRMSENNIQYVEKFYRQTQIEIMEKDCP